MNRVLCSRLGYVAILAAVGLGPGCAKPITLAPVTGKVTVDGKPLSGGQVVFVPDVPQGEKGAKEAATRETGGLSASEIGSDGTFKIHTGGKEGAPLGKYKVTVSPSMVPPPDAKEAPEPGFDKKYCDVVKTPLRKEVVASPKAGDYDLKLTK